MRIYYNYCEPNSEYSTIKHFTTSNIIPTINECVRIKGETYLVENVIYDVDNQYVDIEITNVELI